MPIDEVLSDETLGRIWSYVEVVQTMPLGKKYDPETLFKVYLGHVQGLSLSQTATTAKIVYATKASTATAISKLWHAVGLQAHQKQMPKSTQEQHDLWQARLDAGVSLEELSAETGYSVGAIRKHTITPLALRSTHWKQGSFSDGAYAFSESYLASLCARAGKRPEEIADVLNDTFHDEPIRTASAVVRRIRKLKQSPCLEQIACLQLKRAYHSVEDLTDQLGFPARKIMRVTVPARKAVGRPLTDNEKSLSQLLRNLQNPVEEIGALFGCSAKTIYKHTVAAVPQIKMTPILRERMQQMRDAGVTLSAIARHFSCSQSTVSLHTVKKS